MVTTNPFVSQQLTQKYPIKETSVSVAYLCNKTLCDFGDRPLGPWWLGKWSRAPHSLGGHLALALVAALTLVTGPPWTSDPGEALSSADKTVQLGLGIQWYSVTVWPHQHPSALVIPHSHYCVLVGGSDSF